MELDDGRLIRIPVDINNNPDKECGCIMCLVAENKDHPVETYLHWLIGKNRWFFTQRYYDEED
jgi:hypothetical protein